MRIVRILSTVLAAFVALLIVAGILLAYLFDPNDYKDYLTSFVEERTGRTLSIENDLELSYFPWLAIETGGVTLGNHPDFPGEPFATIESLSARVRVWPLLRREIEIGRIILDGVVVNLGVDAAGNANWDDLLAGGETGSAPPEPGAQDAAGIESLAIEGVRIDNGRVLWREDGEVRYIVSDLEIAMGAIGGDDPVEASIALSALEVAKQREITLELEGVGSIQAGAIRFTDVAAEIVGLDAADRPRVSAALRLDSIAYRDGAVVEIGTGNVEAELTEPPLGPARTELTLSFAGAGVDRNAQIATIEGLTTRLNGIGATWRISGANLIDAPRLTGRVNIEDAPAERLTELLGASLPAEIGSRDLGRFSGGADFDVVIGGTMTFDNIEAAALGLTLNGAATLDAESDLHAEISVPEFAPGATLRGIASAYLPETTDLAAIERLALSGILDMNVMTRAASLTDFSLTVNDASLVGGVTVEPGDAGSRYRGSVRTSRISPELIAALTAGSLTEQVGAEQLGVFALDTEFDYDTARDRAALSALAVEAFGLQATGSAVITNVAASPSVEGRASVATFSPREFLGRFGQPIPESTDPTTLTSARVQGTFVVDADHGDFRELDVLLDNTRITGGLRVDRFEDPSYRFDLSADEVDADRYLPPPVEEVEDADAERTAGDIELSADPLTAFRINGTARVGRLKLANLRFQDVETTLSIGDGKASISPARTRLYGGEFNGGLDVDATGEIPTMALTGQATNLDLTPLIEALAGEANISGTGNFDIDLAGRGPTVTDTLRTAAGKMSFALSNGAIEGFNLGRTLCAAYNLTQKLPQPPDAPERTEYQLIRAAADVTDGVASSPDLLARTAFMDVTGSGRLILADQLLDYDMDAELTNPITIARCDSMNSLIGDSIPFTIRGAVTDAEIKPDFGEILENRVRDELRDRAEERLRDRLQDRLRDLL